MDAQAPSSPYVSFSKLGRSSVTSATGPCSGSWSMTLGVGCGAGEIGSDSLVMRWEVSVRLTRRPPRFDVARIHS